MVDGGAASESDPRAVVRAPGAAATANVAVSVAEAAAGPWRAASWVLDQVVAAATILVVDDQGPNVVLLSKILRSAGVGSVHGLTDPRVVVAACRELRPDLVFVDLHMPDLDGVDVLTGLRVDQPERFLPVVVLTADESLEAKQRALAAGASDFLTKPFDHVEVVLRVRNLLEMRAVYAELERNNLQLRIELAQRDQQRATLLGELRGRIETVLRDNGMSMVFQPVIELETGLVRGVEALARFKREPRRPPNEWFAEAETVGLGPELELAAIRCALAARRDLPEGMWTSINVSAATLMNPALAELLADVAGPELVLEITEHTRVEDYGPLLRALRKLRRTGIRIAVDDTGAGYSGLQHLLRLRPDIIKLDIDVAAGIHADPARRALATALVVFARDIGAQLVAEGIESDEDLVTLRNLHVPFGQGYHLAEPVPAALTRRQLEVGR